MKLSLSFLLISLNLVLLYKPIYLIGPIPHTNIKTNLKLRITHTFENEYDKINKVNDSNKNNIIFPQRNEEDNFQYRKTNKDNKDSNINKEAFNKDNDELPLISKNIDVKKEFKKSKPILLNKPEDSVLITKTNKRVVIDFDVSNLLGLVNENIHYSLDLKSNSDDVKIIHTIPKEAKNLKVSIDSDDVKIKNYTIEKDSSDSDSKSVKVYINNDSIATNKTVTLNLKYSYTLNNLVFENNEKHYIKNLDQLVDPLLDITSFTLYLKNVDISNINNKGEKTNIIKNNDHSENSANNDNSNYKNSSSIDNSSSSSLNTKRLSKIDSVSLNYNNISFRTNYLKEKSNTMKDSVGELSIKDNSISFIYLNLFSKQNISNNNDDNNIKHNKTWILDPSSKNTKRKDSFTIVIKDLYKSNNKLGTIKLDDTNVSVKKESNIIFNNEKEKHDYNEYIDNSIAIIIGAAYSICIVFIVYKSVANNIKKADLGQSYSLHK